MVFLPTLAAHWLDEFLHDVVQDKNHFRLLMSLRHDLLVSFVHVSFVANMGDQDDEMLHGRTHLDENEINDWWNK